MARKYEGSAALPGMDDEGKSTSTSMPKSGLTSRARTAPENAEFSYARAARMAAVIAIFALGALYVFHRFEQFLIRDTRFALNGEEGSWDTATLSITGAAHASRTQIQAVFNDDSGRSVYLLPIADRRLALKSVSWVRDAAIERMWPNRVIVRISERVPVAFVSLGASRFGLIDEDGVILPPAPDRFELPVLAGVKAPDAIEDRRKRVQRMLRLTRELGDAASKISQVDASDPDNLKMTQAWDGRVLTLLMGDHNFAQRYANFVRTYPDIHARLPDARTFDVRLEDRITVVE